MANKFKIGDIVLLKNSNDRYVVVGLPGIGDYDSSGYASASEGMEVDPIGNAQDRHWLYQSWCSLVYQSPKIETPPEDKKSLLMRVNNLLNALRGNKES